MSLSDATLLRPSDEMAPMTANSSNLADDAERLAAMLEASVVTGQACDVPDESMQRVMAALIKVYEAKFDQGQRPALLAADSGVSATAVLVTTSALMKASNLEVFELGMWQSWSGTR
jgi:hypothetical protein